MIIQTINFFDDESVDEFDDKSYDESVDKSDGKKKSIKV